MDLENIGDFHNPVDTQQQHSSNLIGHDCRTHPRVQNSSTTIPALTARAFRSGPRRSFQQGLCVNLVTSALSLLGTAFPKFMPPLRLVSRHVTHPASTTQCSLTRNHLVASCDDPQHVLHAYGYTFTANVSTETISKVVASFEPTRRQMLIVSSGNLKRPTWQHCAVRKVKIYHVHDRERAKPNMAFR